MTITRIGSNATYADGWEKAFGKAVKKSKPAAKKPTTSKKKAAPKKKAKK